MRKLVRAPIAAEQFARKRPTGTRRWLFRCLLLLVVAAPLPFGSVLPWAWGTLAVLTAILLACWAILVVLDRATAAVSFRKLSLAAVSFGAAAIWIALQATSYTPRSWHHPIWAESAMALGIPYFGYVSLDPHDSMTTLTRLLWYGVVFWLALQYCKVRSNAYLALKLLAWSGVAYAAYGLIVYFGGWETVLWVKKTIYKTEVTGTFINKNSFAGFTGMSLLCVSALLLDHIVRARIAAPTWGGRVLVRINVLIGQAWHLLLAWVVVFTAIVLSNSRAGLVCSIVGLVAFGLVLSISKAVPSWSGRWFAGAMAVCAIGFFVLSGETVDRRFAYLTEQSKQRLSIYDRTIEAIGDSPVLGFGSGTFPRIFQIYRQATREHRTPARKAHNTYLENAAELGLPAALSLTASVFLLFLVCLSGVRNRRRDAILPAIGVATTILLGLHSLVDFSLQIPGITVSYAFIMGLSFAQSWSSRNPIGQNRTQ